MDFDFAKLSAALSYKLLVSVVVPRPIALVSTLGRNGVVNAAPYSFFNVVGDDPPILIVSIETRPDSTPKDSARNILETGEFVVNLVDEATVERMHACSRDFPPEESEPAAVGFTPVPSHSIAAPRLAESPVALECTLFKRVELDRARLLAIGQVRWMHCHDDIIDPQTLRVRDEHYHPVGRLYGNRYIRTRDHFSVDTSPEYLASIQARGRL